MAAVNDSAILLRWTAPGDDDSDGRVTDYDIRVSTDSITEANFGSARQVPRSVPPGPAGTLEAALIPALMPSTTYFCAVRALDEADNVGPLSNIVSSQTPAAGDHIAPKRITDLSATALGPASIEVTWTAPGDDADHGTAFAYDLHASDIPFPAGGFPARNKVETPAPAPAGTRERIVIENLQPDRSYYVVLRTADEVFNWSIPSSDTVATSPPPDLVHPGTVTTLVLARQSQTSITVEWEATGDDGDRGIAHHYDVRYAAQAITESSWEAASPVDGEPTPGIPGTKERTVIPNISAAALTYVALKVFDEQGNASALSNVVSGAPSVPGVITVLADGSGDAPTIQAALDRARDGDVIRVGPGTYVENLRFRGYEVQLTSTHGRDQTTIDGRNAPESVIGIDQEEGPATLVEGFTLRNGHCLTAPDFDRRVGGGIRVRNAWPTIRDCRIVGNSSSSDGGVAILSPSTHQVLIEYCDIDSNSSYHGGGGLYLGAGDTRIANLLIRNNTGGTIGEADGGGVFTYGADATFEDCVITGNVATDHGGGLALWNGSIYVHRVVVRRCLITGNSALKPVRTMDGSGGGIHVAGVVGEISNCTIADNRGVPGPGQEGGGISLYLGDPGIFGLRWNIIANNTHGGIAVWSDGFATAENIVWGNSDQDLSGVPLEPQFILDPLFCSPQTGDFRVAFGSPALTGPYPIGYFTDPGCGP